MLQHPQVLDFTQEVMQFRQCLWSCPACPRHKFDGNRFVEYGVNTAIYLHKKGLRALLRLKLEKILVATYLRAE